tara:strand:+ start:5413 stop:9111 length:3699 start_codon:yes stop_codon:yes gene_type:complete
MMIDRLTPTIGVLSDEVVLVQAWKKTAAYIRTHNWYSDTLAIDRASINLPDFIAELSDRILSVTGFRNTPLRLVPAPKSQAWQVTGTGEWKPRASSASSTKLRPLAHVDLADQVLATAFMMCMADRVETAQGDPTRPLNAENIHGITSYGNRLLCDTVGKQLHHRWGGSKLYRSFYQDYQKFLVRPESLASALEGEGKGIYILQSDLRQFYDRVSTDLLHTRVRSLAREGDDPAFYQLFERLMNWSWDRRDLSDVQSFAKNAGLEDFESVALPQGLVASGFFANVVLLPFDQCLRDFIGSEIIPNVELIDATRYVDDLRLVVKVSGHPERIEIEQSLSNWLRDRLTASAPGLMIAEDKTTLSAFRGEERPLVMQSRKMARIQTTISGGIDPIAGGEVLDAVLGLMRTQNRLSEEGQNPNPFTPIADVRDATVNRFAAVRFRNTYRSLRPLLWEHPIEVDLQSEEDFRTSQYRHVRTRSELDNEAKTFALGLISKWVEDPSNVRLMRIGLDIWPSPEILKNVLNLLRPFTRKGSPRKAPRRVAFYCLAELFRAGATETGFVSDEECLPASIDIKEYRRLLVEEAYQLVSQKDVNLPWYVLQQAFLMLATHPSKEFQRIARGNSDSLGHYKSLLRYLIGTRTALSTREFATNAVIARRSFTDSARATDQAMVGLTPAKMNRIASVDPSFAAEIAAKSQSAAEMLTPRMTADLGLGTLPARSLAKWILTEETRDDLRNEVAILSFAIAFLRDVAIDQTENAITPRDVIVVAAASDGQFIEVEGVKLAGSRGLAGTSLYAPPNWAPEAERWRFQLGFLIRFVLSAQRDFTRLVRDASWKEHKPVYRNPESHWYQRTYGLFNGHSAFGDDWLPISEWIEALLFGLLRWPGCPVSKEVAAMLDSKTSALRALEGRLADLQSLQGKSALIIPLLLPSPIDSATDRPFRACVIQTVYPGQDSDFDPDDLTFNNGSSRTKHRRHLSAALASVQSALALRETHKGRDGRLDLLILPELSVHPDDVRTHLIPFARTFRTTILAGLTFERLGSSPLLVNSALWIIPTYDPGRGWKTLVRRQGKANLAPEEIALNKSTPKIRGFRPCQWLIGYPWSSNKSTDPLWMTSSICFDATDIQLAADLKNKSDIFIVPSLNQDVNTYDQLAHSLHYNMFQMVVVANNGTYGGSNAYAPFSKSYLRQVFHLHGQPQASIAFFEIDNIRDFKSRKPNGGIQGGYKFKPPPAG